MVSMHLFGPPLFYGPCRRARRGVDRGPAGLGGSSWDRSPGARRYTRCPHGRAWRPRGPHTACGPSPRASHGTSASRARSRGCTSWAGVRREVLIVPATVIRSAREIGKLSNRRSLVAREPAWLIGTTIHLSLPEVRAGRKARASGLAGWSLGRAAAAPPPTAMRAGTIPTPHRASWAGPTASGQSGRAA